MAGPANQEDDIISGINVTPLVDVMLVLLVIFMITAPAIYQTSIQVELPSAKTGQQSASSPLQISVSKEGEFFVEKERVSMDQIKERVKAAVAKAPDATAIIQADRATSHGTVVELMDALRDAGLYRFALSVQSKQ
ncbi:MAG TPA: biopolymer transporter ExbD [Bdellovibrionota bacterium]|jgi:biopolymer transport protein ExbD|nr:biopolymer transporter ExbD [Bdellovibrionota bacterium]